MMDGKAKQIEYSLRTSVERGSGRWDSDAWGVKLKILCWTVG